jgi:hypothetical protein
MRIREMSMSTNKKNVSSDSKTVFDVADHLQFVIGKSSSVQNFIIFATPFYLDGPKDSVDHITCTTRHKS